MTSRRTSIQLALCAVAALVAVGCGTTVVEDDAEPTVSVADGLQPADESAVPLDSEIVVDGDAPATTLPIEGTAAELLPEIGIDMSRLSAQVGSDEGRTTLARITTTWSAIRPEVESTRPDLVNAIDVTVEMATTSVETNRPADADKAFSLLNDLINSFVGDA